MRQIIVFQHFSRMAACSLAIIQFLLGVALVAVQGVGVHFDIQSTHLGATGIWAGAFVMLSGVGGLVAVCYRTPGAIVSFMLSSVLATLVAPAVAVTSVISVMELEEFCPNSNLEDCDDFMLKKILDITLIIVAVIEYCFAASCVITCCWTLYCDPAGYQIEYEQTQSGKNKNQMELQKKYDGVSDDGFPTIVEEDEPEEDVNGKRWHGSDSNVNHVGFVEPEEEEEEEEEEHQENGISNMGYVDEVTEDPHVNPA